MNDIYGGITFVIVCFIRSILYFITIIIIMAGEFYGIDLVFEIVSMLLVISCIVQYYRMYKLRKPSNIMKDSGININLLDEQNNSSYHQQVIQPVPQYVQPPLQPPLQPQQVMQSGPQYVQLPVQPPVQPQSANPNEGYYPGPPMYDNNYINQNNGGYNV